MPDETTRYGRRGEFLRDLEANFQRFQATRELESEEDTPGASPHLIKESGSMEIKAGSYGLVVDVSLISVVELGFITIVSVIIIAIPIVIFVLLLLLLKCGLFLRTDVVNLNRKLRFANAVTTTSIKVKTLLFDGITNFNAFKLQFGVVATKNMWDDDDKAVALMTSLRVSAAEIIQIIPEGKRTEFAAVMDALERKYGAKHVKEDFVTRSLKKLYGRHLKRRSRKRLASRLRKKQLVCCENDISDVVCAALRQVVRENKRMPISKTRKRYACQKPGHFARECRSKHKGSHSTSPSRNIRGGEEAAIKGKIMRNISISDVSMKHEFLVADIMDEVILGMDFMAKHGFILDMKRQVLQYVSVTLLLTVGYDRQAEVLQVVVQRQQKIPPNSEAIVWATVTQEIRLSKIWIVEPSTGCTKDNIIIGKAVVSPVNNLIPVRGLNPTSDTTKVQKGDIIAQCKKAEYVVNHQVEIPKTCSKISPEAEIFIQRWTRNLDEQQKINAKKFLLENWTIVAGVTSSDKYSLRNNQCVSIYPCYFPGCSSGSNYTTKHTVILDITKLTPYSKQYIIGGDLKYLHDLWGCETVNYCIRLIYKAVDADRMQVMYPTK
uniref:CCHC-type domain-containing protein n=1 Tax=Glossina pallidipes TaxID=7398 RepID=A0A1A9ZYB0_GLOPL